MSVRAVAIRTGAFNRRQVTSRHLGARLRPRPRAEAPRATTLAGFTDDRRLVGLKLVLLGLLVLAAMALEVPW